MRASLVQLWLLVFLLVACEDKAVDSRCEESFFCEAGLVYKNVRPADCGGKECACSGAVEASLVGRCTHGCASAAQPSPNSLVCAPQTGGQGGAAGNSGEDMGPLPLHCQDVFFCSEGIVYQGPDGVFCGFDRCDLDDCRVAAAPIDACPMGCSTSQLAPASAGLCELSTGGAGGGAGADSR